MASYGHRAARFQPSTEDHAIEEYESNVDLMRPFSVDCQVLIPLAAALAIYQHTLYECIHGRASANSTSYSMEEAIWRLEENREALEAKIQDLNQRLTMHR
jgi:hypothetical protein